MAIVNQPPQRTHPRNKALIIKGFLTIGFP